MNHLALTAADVLAMTPRSLEALAIDFMMSKIVETARNGMARHIFGTFDIVGSYDIWKTGKNGDYVLTPTGEKAMKHFERQGFKTIIYRDGHYPVIEINWANADGQ